MKRLLTIFATTAAVVAVFGAPAAGHGREQTYAISQTTPAGPTPHFPGYDAASGNVLVSNPSAGTVTELALGAGPTRSFAAGAVPHTVVVDSRSRRAFVTNKGAASVSVLDLDTGATASFAVGPNPHGLAIDNARNRLYVTSIDADQLEVYDLQTLELVATVPVGDGPWGVTVEAGRIAVTDTAGSTVHLIDATTLKVRDVVEVGQGPWNARFAGSTLFVTLERAGEVVAVRHGQIIWRTQVGASPHGIVVDQRRGTVLAAVTGTNNVVVLDSRTGDITQTIAMPAGPAGITIDPDTGRVWVDSHLTPTGTQLPWFNWQALGNAKQRSRGAR